MVPLARAEAFANLTESDKRPLLVLRECDYCKGTEDAFLSRTLDNERTKLLARWFHCVKLKPHVLVGNHRFHHLFGSDNPPHLFLATDDGSKVISFDGQQSQRELWSGMIAILREAYAKDPEEAVKEIRRLLDAYDRLDAAERQLRSQYEAEVESRGSGSAKAKRLAERIEETAREREELKAREAEAADLRLKRPA